MSDSPGPVRCRQSELTRPGWPRPVVDGWPVPWVSPPRDLSTMDGARKIALLDTRACQVCGLCHDPGDVVYLCVDSAVGEDGRPTDVPADTVSVVCMDGAVMHERCARLALGRCPRLLALRRDRSLLVLSALADHVYSWNDSDLVVALEHVTVVDLGKLGVYSRGAPV